MTPPLPSFNSIDYSAPAHYVSLDSSFVGDTSLTPLAQQFAADNVEVKLGKIWRWLANDFEIRNETAEYGWRTAGEIIQRRAYIGCADHALVYGCIARACGIPTVWVKSMHIEWIRTFRQTLDWDGGKGHVYLEMFLSGQWRLVDATQDEIFDDYDPAQRLLPGRDCDRYAYDKGGDPRALVLSLDWKPWVEQTQHIFSTFDLADIEGALPATRSKGRRMAV